MSNWIVYGKDGITEKCEVRSIQYSGEFMGACSITATINSPTPIGFEIGDYLVYRGERFELNYDPSVLKQARRGSYGEGFVYENMVFNSLSDELTRCNFLDYVPNDNNIHYSSLPNFSFYAETISDLAERIQVNLDRVYTGENKWTVIVHEEYVNKKDVNISVSSINCWDALALAKSEFDANFTIKGRTITIGTEGIAVEKIFSQGKGNGLITIERNAESNQQIITRLRAYGSTRNLPELYYKNLGLEVFANVTHISEKGSSIRFYTDLYYSDKYFTKDAYDSEGNKYGKVVRISCEGIDVRARISATTNGSLSLIEAEYGNSLEWKESNRDKLEMFISSVNEGSKILFSGYIKPENFPYNHKKYSEAFPNNMAVKNLMLPDFPHKTTDPYIDSENIDELGVREGTVFFDGSGDLKEIYPSMDGMTAEELKAAGVIIDSEGELDVVVEAEQIEDDGFFKEGTENIPTFTIRIKDIGFDINEHLGTSSATISMKNGMCGGREFEIVRCENDEKGYVLTCNRSYDESIDLYFPYNGFQINSGDKFVLLNIEMPDVYILAASQRLLEAAKEYLAKNDYVRYSYTPKVDNIFLARQHDEALANNGISIHDTIKEGDILLFNDEDLNVEGSVIIDSLSIKEGDSLIPEYEVTLRNDKAVGTIEKIQNQIDSIASGKVGSSAGGYNSAQIKSLISAYGSTIFLRKDKDDRSKGKIATDKAIEVGNFVSGASGAMIYKDATTGHTIGELDKLYVRMKAYFETLEIINVNSIGGKQIISPAGSVKCVGIEETETYYRCYFLAEQDGEKVQNRWMVGDQAYSQMFNAKEGVSNKVSNKYYWRLVVGVSDESVTYNNLQCHYVDLSVTDCDNDSDVPSVGDVINQRGSRTDLDRMNFIEMSSVDSFSPNVTLFHGVNSYSLDGKAYVSYGVDKSTNKAFMNVYGDMYVGDRQESSFMRYTQESGLEIKGQLSVGTTLGGKDLQGLIDSATPEGYEDFVNKVTQDIEGLQAQVDGAIDSYFYQYEPSLTNYPAMEWDTEDEKKAHLNDTFTNLVDGRSWRWTVDNGYYKWTEITDTATTQALALAGQAQDTADGKRRVFIEQPYPPYDLGDLWASGGDSYLMRCFKARETGIFDPNDWDYADKTAKIEESISTFDYLKAALKEDTNIEGGLIQSSLLELGYTDETYGFKVMSGTNGIYNSQSHGGGIASWWGGGLHDILDYFTWNGEEWLVKSGTTVPTDMPSGLIRMDGTGYFAKGNFWWDANGKIYADPTSLFLMFDVEDEAKSLSSTILALRDKQTEFESMWSVKTDSNGVKYLYSTFPLATQGGITMYSGTEGLDIPSIYNGLPIDGTTIYWENGVLKSLVGGGTADAVAWGNITDKPSWIGSTKPSYNMGEISNVGSWANSVADVDRIMYQAAGSSMWVAKSLSDLAVGGVSGDYLPLSGGTLTGTSNTPLVLKGAETNTYIAFRGSDDTFFGSIGVRNDNFAYLYAGGYSHQLLHSGNYSNYALPLTGGTVSSSSFGPLSIMRLGGNYSGAVKFYNEPDGYLGALGVGGSYNNFVPEFEDKNGNTHTLLHSGNYSSYALPLSGGTIKRGNEISPLIIDTDSLLDVGLRFLTSGASKGWVGYSATYGTNLYNHASDVCLSVKDNGTLYYSKGTIWHSGNDGSGSGLDADLLDGKQPSDLSVGSATKLQTARTIWGQSFDGTYNVNGDFTVTSGSKMQLPNGRELITFHNDFFVLGYGNCPSGVSTYLDGYDIRFRTGSSWSTSMLIDGYGNVGIGTTSPSYKLDINSSVGDATRITTSVGYSCIIYKNNGAHTWSVGSNNSNQFYFYNSGYGSIVAYIDGNGNFLSKGGITMYSQRSLKNIVDERGLSLNELSIIKPTRYTWKDGRDDRLHFGGIADDIQQVLPEVVYKAGDNVLTMDYGNAAFAIASSLIKPVIDHEQRIVMLEQENRQLRQELERLKSA